MSVPLLPRALEEKNRLACPENGQHIHKEKLRFAMACVMAGWMEQYTDVSGYFMARQEGTLNKGK